MAVRLIIFDLDGTLVDSIADIAASLNVVIAPYMSEPVTADELKPLVGGGAIKLTADLLFAKNVPLDRTAVAKIFVEHYANHLTDRTLPYPGVIETLEKLADQKKAVLSNKLTHLTQRVIEQLALARFFEYVAGGDSSPEKKPSAAPILRVLEHFGMSADEGLMVGDSVYDIEAGRAAGVKTVAALYGYGQGDYATRADFTIREFSELLEIVKKLGSGE
jgi:phosphoglycolate phosphatase